MDRWTLVAVVLAVALPGALAGCIARSQGLDAAGAEDDPAREPVEALANVERARELARAWRADARLVSVFASEGMPSALEDPPFLFDTAADALVGDGRALVWTYAFSAAEESRTFFAAIDAAGAIRYADDLPGHGFGAPMPMREHVAPASSSPSPHAEMRAEPAPVPDLDDALMRSADAASLVAANATTQAWLAEHPTSVARLHLVAAPDGAIWMVLRATATGYSLHAAVDARALALRELYRFPDDLYLDPPTPCPEDAACRPYEPQPPPQPPGESHARAVTVDAFNPRAEWPFLVGAHEWAADVVVRADAGGATPLDAVTITVYDPMGGVAGSATGTGAIEIAFEHGEDFPWGGEYRVAVEPQAPGPLPREIELTADVSYTRWLGGASYQVDSMGGYVRMRQAVEHVVRVEEGTSLLKLRYSFDEALSGIPSGATIALLDPAGNEAASGKAPVGEFEMESPTRGDWVVRVTGNDGNALGTSYWLSASRAVPWAWL